MSDELTGGTLGKYHLLEIIGRGSHGLVYLGHDPFVDRPVAVKVARGQCSGGRFFVEAQVGASLQHPNITAVFDAGSDGDYDYIVTELVPHHRTVADFCTAGQRLAALEVVRIIRECAEALAHAHTRHALHRDIKPRNILLDTDLKAHITDFGLAVPPTETLSGWMAGSPAYMAPELFDGGSHSVQSDIYALGVVLFEMLAGALPFPTQDFDTYRRAVERGRALPLKHFRSDELPPILQMVIDRCLVKRVERRYRRASDLAGDLAVASDFLTPAPVRKYSQRQLESLRKLREFDGVSQDDLLDLLQAGSVRSLEAGQSLDLDPAAESRLILILDGELRFDPGRQHWHKLGPGAALLVPTELRPPMMALSRCKALVIGQAPLERLHSGLQIRLYRSAALAAL